MKDLPDITKSGSGLHKTADFREEIKTSIKFNHKVWSLRPNLVIFYQVVILKEMVTAEVMLAVLALPAERVMQ